ncbi:MAG: hypothetical protein JRJ72_06240 [Deltaproteobacteria bacterium]|nr:hypothetical protein [Deltaproteobacteria bacterium]
MRTAVPAVRFFLADRSRPVFPGNEDWRRLLPQDRHGAPGPAAVGCGEYFEAVSRFLSRDDWRAVRLAATALVPGWPPDIPLTDIEIFLEKHGACYHPARVVAGAEGRRVELVVNVALSPEAMALLATEAALIPRLGDRFNLGYLPAVFERGDEILAGGRRLMMFLGQWFSGFHEFHLEGGGKEGPPELVVWAPGGARRLQGRQCRALYRQAATVLAGYYDVFSGEQILDWHHAAGDFVVRLDEADELALRLVTVRRYGALLRDPPGDLASALLHLALFLVHTTLWLRLDRYRGVGDLVMADPAVVGPVLGGIGDALALKVQRGEMPAAMLEAAAAYLSACRRRDLVEMIHALAVRRPSGDPTRRLIEKVAVAHADHLRTLLGAGNLFGL